MLRAASQELQRNLELGEIARNLEGRLHHPSPHCWTRSSRRTRRRRSAELLMNWRSRRGHHGRAGSLADGVQTAARMGVAVPAYAASLGYFDSYRRDRLPANSSRRSATWFGAHTYERIDKPGGFHTEW